ncbi:MAG: hypothetical protein CL912_09250 [Deltaproteobacteria bacterium]|nr:hypothetical protein [Deltaproteobacteria bacterium]
MNSRHLDRINTSHNHFSRQDLASIQANLDAQQQAQVQRDAQIRHTAQPHHRKSSMAFLGLWSNDCPNPKDHNTKSAATKDSKDPKPKPPPLPKSISSKATTDNDTKSTPASKKTKEPKPPKASKPAKEPKKPKEPKSAMDSKPADSQKRSWFALPQKYEPAKPPVNLTKAPILDIGSKKGDDSKRKGNDTKDVKSTAEGSKTSKAADRKAKKSKEHQSSDGQACDCPHD